MRPRESVTSHCAKSVSTRQTAPAMGDVEKAQLLNGDPLAARHDKRSEPRAAAAVNAVTTGTIPRSHTLWILSTAISLASTRYILITKSFHFPMILLIWQLAATILLVSLRLFLGGRASSSDNPDSQEPSDVGFPVNLRTLASFFLAVAALPVTYQAILHFPNIATLVMFSVHAIAVSELLRLLPLNMPTSLNLKAGLRPSNETLKIFGPAIVAVISSYFMFATDYRLTSRGDRSLLVATYLTAFAQAFLTFSNHRDRQTTLSLDHFQLVLTCGALVLATSWYFPFEGPYATLQLPDFWLLAGNLVSTAMAIASGGSMIVPLSEPQPRASEDPTRFSNSLRQRLVTCFSLTGIVCLASLILPNRGFVNLFQFFCYGTTLAALLFGSATQNKFSLRGILRLNGASKTLTVIAILCWIIYIPLNFTDYPFGQTGPVSHSRIDHNYVTEHRFDVVVAEFAETAEEVADLFTRITSVRPISHFNARLIVYSKRENFDKNKFKAALEKAFKANPGNQDKFSYVDAGFVRTRAFPDIRLHQLDNYGREGATYATHMSKYYDSLAQHTLFTQASVHDLEDMLRRIQYLVPGPPIIDKSQIGTASDWWGKLGDLKYGGFKHKGKHGPPRFGRSTGMLPLGFTTEVCDCHKCSDTWGWHDTSPLVPGLFKTSFGLTSAECKNIVLTYKGQFIVSAQRIRGLTKENYIDLRDSLTRDDRWEHSKAYLENYTGHGGVNKADTTRALFGGKAQLWGEKDSIQRPWFGYTIERMWGVIMQCSDMRVAWKCPTMKSRWRGVFGGDKGDCQCFDMVRPPDGDA